MAKSLAPAAKTAAELSALLTQETRAQETARAEHELLAAQDKDIARQGVDALRRHRQLMLDAELRRDVAKANADVLREQLAEAEKREAEQARRARYDAQLRGRSSRQEKYRNSVISAYEMLLAALAAGKTEQDDTTSINRDLPAGATPIEDFEAPWRHTPAVPTRTETVTVQRRKENMTNVVFGPGRDDHRPMETVCEERVIPGTPARRLQPLWERVELPRFDNDFLTLRVGDTLSQPGDLKVA